MSNHLSMSNQQGIIGLIERGWSQHRIARELPPCHTNVTFQFCACILASVLFDMAADVTQFSPEHFLNRELSWLAFNQRVLDEALDPTTPLLERVKFFCIASSNLDEFFEVRVAGVKQQIESDVVERSVDGLTASESFRAIHRRVRKMIEAQFRCWRNELVPALAENGIRFLEVAELDPADRVWVESYFHQCRAACPGS